MDSSCSAPCRQLSLSNRTPKELGESGDSGAIPILHEYLQKGGIQQRTHAASAIRKLSASFRAECSATINSLFECAANGTKQQNAELRQYSLLALEQLDIPGSRERWLRERLEHESVDYVREVIFRILATMQRKKVAEFEPERIRDLNTILSQYCLLSLWHITHKANLWSVCRYGILNHGDAHKRRPALQDISDPAVQRWRTKKDPIYHRAIHDYAPLYLNARNPMLYKRKARNSELCLVEVCPTILLTHKYLLTDGNAASATTSFYQDYRDLYQLPWDVLHGGSWRNKLDGKRKMCAEALIFPRVWPVYIKAVHVYDSGGYNPPVAGSFPIHHSPNLFFQ